MHSYVEVSFNNIIELVGKVEYSIRLYRYTSDNICVREYITSYNKILAKFRGVPSDRKAHDTLTRRGNWRGQPYPCRSYEAAAKICEDIRSTTRVVTTLSSSPNHVMYVTGQSIELLEIALRDVRQFVNQYNQSATVTRHNKLDTGGVL